MNSLDDITRDLVKYLEARSIPYALMGGLAVRIHAVPRATFDVDFTVSIARPDLASLYASVKDLGKERHRVDGFEAWFVSPEDLILSKLLAGRPKDLVDVADVLFIQGDLDVIYLRLWAGRLGILESLEQALRSV